MFSNLRHLVEKHIVGQRLAHRKVQRGGVVLPGGGELQLCAWHNCVQQELHTSQECQLFRPHMRLFNEGMHTLLTDTSPDSYRDGMTG